MYETDAQLLAGRNVENRCLFRVVGGPRGWLLKGPEKLLGGEFEATGVYKLQGIGATVLLPLSLACLQMCVKIDTTCFIKCPHTHVTHNSDSFDAISV